MTFEQRIRVIAVLAKYLRTHTVAIAAIGKEKKLLNRQVMIERLVIVVSKDKDVWTDILYIFSSVLGAEQLNENIDLKEIIDRFYRGWRHNRLDRTVSFCVEVGVLSQKDIANMLWVVANWRSGSG